MITNPLKRDVLTLSNNIQPEITRLDALDSDMAQRCISTHVYKELWKTGVSKPFNANLTDRKHGSSAVKPVGGDPLSPFPTSIPTDKH